MANRPRLCRWLLALALALLVMGAVLVRWPRPRPAPTSLLFDDITSQARIDFTYRNGEQANEYTILESLGGGVAVFDYDGDGWRDIFLVGGGRIEPGTLAVHGHANALYRNRGDGTFENVTEQVGLATPLFYGHGAYPCDIDADGDDDLLVTGWNRMALFRNEGQGRDRRFVDITREAGLTDTRWSTAAAWGDLDGDGLPDLYVAHYVDWSATNHPVCVGELPSIPKEVCAPQKFHPLRHRLYKNNGKGTFTDMTEAVGLQRDGKGLGVVMLDLDGDGRNDLYVANDAGANFLYLNQGAWTFKESGRFAGVALDALGMVNGSMGVDAADYDGSGRPSLWVTNYQNEDHALYQHQQPGVFRHASKDAGITALGQQFVGFGTGFLDVDNDGWEDLVIAHGHVLRHPTRSSVAQRPVLLQNVARSSSRGFREWPTPHSPYFEQTHRGRGLAIGDLDNDGRADLVISHLNEPVRVLRNVAPPQEWLGLELRSTTHRSLTGTIVTLDVGGQRQTRFVKGGGSYLSTHEQRVLFGLGTNRTPGPLTIRWPNGTTQTQPAPARNTYTILHGP